MDDILAPVANLHNRSLRQTFGNRRPKARVSIGADEQTPQNPAGHTVTDQNRVPGKTLLAQPVLQAFFDVAIVFTARCNRDEQPFLVINLQLAIEIAIHDTAPFPHIDFAQSGIAARLMPVSSDMLRDYGQSLQRPVRIRGDKIQCGYIGSQMLSENPPHGIGLGKSGTGQRRMNMVTLNPAS